MKPWVLFAAGVLLLAGLRISASAACGTSDRFLKLDPIIKRDVEIGDSWQGNIAQGAVCGGCDYVNRPGGHSDPNYQRATFTIDWGDGTQPSELNMDASIGQLSGSHTFLGKLPLDADKKATKAELKFSGHCWDTGGAGNWDEVVTSSCETPPTSARGKCVPQDTAFTIYSSVPPKVVVPQGIKLHAINRGGLAVSLERAAPPSGTKITITSDDPRMKFRDADHPFSSTLETRVSAGSSSQDFDVDTQQLATPRQVKITVKTLAGTKSISLRLPAEAKRAEPSGQ